MALPIKKAQLLGFLKKTVWHFQTSADIVLRGTSTVDKDLKKVEDNLTKNNNTLSGLVTSDPLTLESYWTSNGASPSIVKIGNVVFLSGIIRSGSVAAGYVVARFPAKYAPKMTVVSMALSDEGNSALTIGTDCTVKIASQIKSNGNVELQAMWTL